MKKDEIITLPLDVCGEEKNKKYSDEYYFIQLNKLRHIRLFNTIDDEVAELICTKIEIMNVESSLPITIEINSGGGDVASGISIINAIRHSKAPIVTVINGECLSMAAMISIFGHIRKIEANSSWMQHPTASMISDDVAKIQDRTQYLIKAEKEMEKMIKSRTKLNAKDLLKIRHGELWLDAKECKQKGVVDQIIK